MTRWILIVVIVGSVAACERRAAVPPGEGIAVDTMSARDSVADSTARDTATRTKTGSPPIIGHDSAFGPIGALDSNGKLIPIQPRRP